MPRAKTLVRLAQTHCWCSHAMGSYLTEIHVALIISFNKYEKKQTKKIDEFLKVSHSHPFQWFIKSFGLKFEHVGAPSWF